MSEKYGECRRGQGEVFLGGKGLMANRILGEKQGWFFSRFLVKQPSTPQDDFCGDLLQKCYAI